MKEKIGTKKPEKKKEVLFNGMEFIFIQGGCYMMGCVPGDDKCEDDEMPAHKVCVSDFYIGKKEVTVEQFEQCVREGGCSKGNYKTKSDDICCNYGHADRKDHPMNCVNWYGAKEYAAWLSKKTGQEYRLPTEAKWEYAARSQGKDIIYPWGNATATCEYAVMKDGGNGCDRGSTWEVCSKPNGNTGQGLCDMGGNVWEWVVDWYDRNYY